MSFIPPEIGECSWLPGDVEVPVAGVNHHLDGFAAAEEHAKAGGQTGAVLVPEPDNSYDRHAVAVYVLNHLVGYVPASVAESVQFGLTRYSAAHDGRLVACPAAVSRRTDGTAKVVLLLEVAALGLRAHYEERPAPDLAVTLTRYLRSLDQQPPTLTGIDNEARAMLAEAESMAEAVDKDYNRPKGARERLRRKFDKLVDQLMDADDPMIGRAWFRLASQLQYLPGYRDECLSAYVRAIYHDRGYVEAWEGLVEYAARAPHVPTFLDLAARMPLDVRPQVLKTLLAISQGDDRDGLMDADDGEELRAGLLELARAQSDGPMERQLTKAMRR